MKLQRTQSPSSTTATVSRTTQPAPGESAPQVGHVGVDVFVGGPRAPKVPVLVPPSSRTVNPNDLTYEGGRVLKNPEFQPIYVGKYFSTAAGKADAAYNDAFAKDLVGSAHEAILKQYGVGNGTFGGSATVSVTNPKKFTRADAVALVKKELASGAVKGGPETVHMLVLPPGTVLDAGGGVTSKQGLGGFHGSYVDANGKNVYFGVVAYSKGTNGIDFTGTPRDNISITESHEFDEAATDPDVENGKLGWYNQQYGEIGDLAVNSGLVPFEKTWARDAKGFAVQVEWSNADHAFEAVKK